MRQYGTRYTMLLDPRTKESIEYIAKHSSSVVNSAQLIRSIVAQYMKLLEEQLRIEESGDRLHLASVSKAGQKRTILGRLDLRL